jgi:tetratricopeptide (TPR) repeat protein
VRALLSLSVILLLAAPADARGKAEARDAYRLGTQLYNLSEYQQALEKFKQAYLDYPDPSFLFNIGQCHRQLGQKSEAVRSYRAYLREAPGAPNRKEVTELIQGLEKALSDEEAAKRMPPPGTLESAKPSQVEAPAPTAAPALAPAVAAERPAPPARTPVYKKWWLWTIVGVAAVGLGVGLGVGLAASSTNYPSGTFTDGTVRF